MSDARFDEIIHPEHSLVHRGALGLNGLGSSSFVRDRGSVYSALSKQFSVLENPGYVTIERLVTNRRRRVRVSLTDWPESLRGTWRRCRPSSLCGRASISLEDEEMAIAPDMDRTVTVAVRRVDRELERSAFRRMRPGIPGDTPRQRGDRMFMDATREVPASAAWRHFRRGQRFGRGRGLYVLVDDGPLETLDLQVRRHHRPITSSRPSTAARQPVLQTVPRDGNRDRPSPGSTETTHPSGCRSRPRPGDPNLHDQRFEHGIATHTDHAFYRRLPHFQHHKIRVYPRSNLISSKSKAPTCSSAASCSK